MASCKKCIAAVVIGLFVVTAVTSTHGKQERSDEVRHLIGEPDFRDVALQWEYEEPSEKGAPPPAFQVRYCEVQAWGPLRCRTKLIDNIDESSNHILGPTHSRRGRAYTARVSGLRMATTYSFEVRPLTARREMRADPQFKDKSIIVPTKGFSARATQCLPHVSEVEVSTGPHFGGRIAVEAADGERCAVAGEPASGRDTYTLRINHEECGSTVNDSTVATFVIVQENLPILTHSTRRFLVLCSYKPETLTVRAGINLPANGASPNVRFYRPQSGSAEPFDSHDDAINEVQPARLEARLTDQTTGNTAQAVLMVLLVVAGVAGMAVLVWKVIPGSRANSDTISVTSYGTSATRDTEQALDNQSDTGSIYSISLSECGHCGDSTKHTDFDNTSEA